jgi:archaellum component FlaC
LLKTLLEPNTGFIPKIIEQFKNISPNEAASLKAAGEFLGSLLPGLAEMTKVMPSMVEAATKLADLFYTGVAKDVGTILTSVTNTMTTFIGHLGGMIATIMTSVTPILSNSAISPEKLKAASSIGDIMKGVGEVLKALVPPPETVKAFNSVQDDMGYSSGIDSAALNRYVNDVMTNLTGIVGNETSGIMGMVKSIATMSITPDQIEKLKGIAPIITAIGDLINHITPSSQILDRITQQVAGNEHRGGVANLNKDIITAFMDKIKTELDGIIPTIKSFITEIADKLNSINPASIEGLKAIAPIVSSIGSLIGNLMPASAILDRITQTSRSGGLTTEQMQSNRTKIGEFFTTLTGYLNDLFLGSSNTSRGGGTRTGGIIGFIGKLTELLSSANLDETNVKGLTVIGGLVTSIANMIVPIMGALQTFGQSVTGRDAGTVYQQGQQMTAIIEAVTTAIETIFSTTLPALVSSIVHMELPRSGVHGLESRVKAIKGIFDIVGSLATIISGFKTENGTGGGFHGNMLNMWHEVFNPIISLLTYMFVVGDNGGIRGEGDKLKRVIDALSSDTFKNLSNLGRRTTNLKSLFEALGTVATTAKTLKDTFHGTANTINLGDLDAGFSSIQNALAPFQTGGRAEFLLQTGSGSLFENINKAHSNLVGTGRNAKGMGTKLEEIKKQLGTLKDSSADLITSMSGISSVSTSEMDRSLGNLKTNVNGILTSLDTFVTDMATSNHNEGRVGRILAAIGGRSFLGQVHQAVNAYGNFSKELATLTAQIGAQSFDVSLNRLGETLTGHADRTISNAAANVQVNINVRLEAGQVAEALYNYSTGPGSSPHGGAPRPYGFTRAAQANGTGTFG